MTTQIPGDKPFMFCDATSFTDRPVPVILPAMTRVRCLTQQFAGADAQGVYDISKFSVTNTQAQAKITVDAGALACIDIEDGEAFGSAANEKFSFDVRGGNPNKYLDYVCDVLDALHQGTPACRRGWYGDSFSDEYWTPVAGTAQQLRSWYAAHAYVRAYITPSRIDWIAPSLYTFYQDRTGWVKRAKIVIAEAKQWDKPVYPFIWMYYHTSSEFKGQLIDPNYWGLQIQTLIDEGADGVVIWGGWQIPFDSTSLWLQVLRQKMGGR